MNYENKQETAVLYLCALNYEIHFSVIPAQAGIQ